MNTRRFSLLASLLLTAALLYALPTLWGQSGARGRTEERLMPPKTRTLSVWLVSDDINDRRLINELCADFEKSREGTRVFLRRVDADELNAHGGVPPDVALYATGDLREPKESAVRLAAPDEMPSNIASAGMSAGEPYALPLWYEAAVLAFPYKWLSSDATPPPENGALFGLQTPPPEAAAPPFPSADELPWRELLQSGALACPQGVELQQLLYTCPASVRSELVASQASPAAGSAPARVMSYSRAREAGDASMCLYPLRPAASQRARLASIMRDSEDARAFLRWLTGEEAQEAALLRGLMPSMPPDEIADPALAALAELYGEGALIVNAFEHTSQELQALCADAFKRMEEPTLTLLRLR